MTNSRKTTVKIFVIVLALLALTMTLVACNNGNGPAHYDYLVTFNYNLGDLNSNATNQQIGLLGENPLVQIWPGFTNGEVTIEEYAVNGYYIEGWYLPKSFNDDGTPVKDEKGFVLLGEKWDFEYDRVSESFTLYANLQKKPCIRFVDRATGNLVEGTSGYIERVPGERAFKPSESAAPTISGKTFLGKYYTTIDGDTEFTWPYRMGKEDVFVYVSFLDGEWAFVNNETEFLRMVGANRNIYLQKNLDFSSYNEYTPGFSGVANYSGILEGNNHTISNITRKFTASKNDTNGFGGVFNTLGATAHIRNVSFLNINISSFGVNSSYVGVDVYVGLLAYAAEAGAKISNVTITGTLNYNENNDYTITAGIIGINKTNVQDIIDYNHDGVVINKIEQNNN